jgi:hypothetical protein
MIDAKQEIIDSLFCKTPLSLETMICSLIAIEEYMNVHGDDCDATTHAHVDMLVKTKAKEKLNYELQKGLDSIQHGTYTIDEVDKILNDINACE